jgi:hypothetical protein
LKGSVIFHEPNYFQLNNFFIQTGEQKTVKEEAIKYKKQYFPECKIKLEIKTNRKMNRFLIKIKSNKTSKKAYE